MDRAAALMLVRLFMDNELVEITFDTEWYAKRMAIALTIVFEVEYIFVRRRSKWMVVPARGERAATKRKQKRMISGEV